MIIRKEVTKRRSSTGQQLNDLLKRQLIEVANSAVALRKRNGDVLVSPDRFSSGHFLTTRRDSTHGTLWRLCTRIAHTARGGRDTLAFQKQLSRLWRTHESLSRFSLLRESRLETDHLLARWQGLMCLFSDAWFSSSWARCERKKDREHAKRKRRVKSRGRKTTWSALFREIPLPFPLNPRAYMTTFFFLHFRFYFFSPTLRGLSHYRDEPTMKITSSSSSSLCSRTARHVNS